MECQVPKANLRAFAHALHTLGKVGKEVFFHAKQDEVGKHASVLHACQASYVMIVMSMRACSLSSEPSMKHAPLLLRLPSANVSAGQCASGAPWLTTSGRFSDFFELFRPHPDGTQVVCKFFVKVCLEPGHCRPTLGTSLPACPQSVHNLLKSLRNVDGVKITFEHGGVSHFLVFQLACRHGVAWLYGHTNNRSLTVGRARQEL